MSVANPCRIRILFLLIVPTSYRGERMTCGMSHTDSFRQGGDRTHDVLMKSMMSNKYHFSGATR